MRCSEAFHSTWPAIAAALLLALTGAAARAQVVHETVPSQAYPGDRVGVPAYGGGCPALLVDPDVAPRARTVQHYDDPANPEHDNYQHELRYDLVESQDDVCGTPPPPDHFQLIDVGPLPPGWHSFTVTAYFEGQAIATYDTASTSVRVQEAPGPELSGVWYPPGQSGRGVFVVTSNTLVAVWWSTHDAEGDPLWVGTTASLYSNNRFAGEAITSRGPPLAPGPADISVERWGELAFSYHGCGRATLEWEADDPALGEGSVDLVQLMVPSGLVGCDPRPRLAGQPALWESAQPR